MDGWEESDESKIQEYDTDKQKELKKSQIILNQISYEEPNMCYAQHHNPEDINDDQSMVWRTYLRKLLFSLTLQLQESQWRKENLPQKSLSPS